MNDMTIQTKKKWEWSRQRKIEKDCITVKWKLRAHYILDGVGGGGGARDVGNNQKNKFPHKEKMK